MGKVYILPNLMLDMPKKEDSLSDCMVRFVFRKPKQRDSLTARLKIIKSKKRRIKRNFDELPERVNIENMAPYKSFQGYYVVTVDRRLKDVYYNRFSREDIPKEISIILETLLQETYAEFTEKIEK